MAQWDHLLESMNHLPTLGPVRDPCLLLKWGLKPCIHTCTGTIGGDRRSPTPEMKHIWGSQMAQAVLGEMSLLGWEHGALAGRERQRTEPNIGVTGRSTRKKSQRTAYIHRNKQHLGAWLRYRQSTHSSSAPEALAVPQGLYEMRPTPGLFLRLTFV